MPLPRPLRGLITPLATPLSAPDRLDVASLERLVQHLLDGGVDGLFLLGTTGEGPSLDYDLRRELIRRVASLAGGRIPVMAAITDTCRQASLALARYAAEEGLDAVVIAAPYYFPMTQEELAGYVERLSRELPLPLFLYNMPSHTKVNFAPETVRRLSGLANVHGLKDSSGDLAYFEKVLEAVSGERPEFSVLIGPEEHLVQSMRMGGHGGVCGGSNIFPELFVRLYQAARDGDTVESERLQAIVTRFGQVAYSAEGNYLKGMKAALALAGLCATSTLSEPFEALRQESEAQVRQAIVEAREAFAAVCR